MTRLSAGEFVINADATSKHRALLEAINSGQVARFADGGAVSAPRPIPTPTGISIGGTSANRTNHFNVSIQGSPGTPNQNQDLADRMGRSLKEAAQSHGCERAAPAPAPGRHARAR